MSTLAQRIRRAWATLTGAPPVTLVGHSHLWALKDAVAEARADIRVVDFWKHADPFGGNELSVLDDVLPAPVRGPVVSLIGGSRYNTLALYESPRPFDFVLPGDPAALREGCEILTLDAVRASLQAVMGPNQALMRAVRERTNGRMYHLEAPAPWGEARDPKDYPRNPWDPVSDRFGDRRLRLKLSRLETGMMRDFCTANDIVFIAAPPAARTEEGFLRPEYFGDLMHANAAYGRMALAAVLQAVKK
jgi:hypothetical protein